MDKGADLIQKYGLTLLLEIDSSSDVLKDHLSFAGCEENLLFWREANKFKTMFTRKEAVSKDALDKQVLLLLEEFIKPEGTHCIAMSTAMRKSIKSRIASKTYSSDMFDECLKTIEDNLADGPYPNFAGKIQETIKDSWKKCLEKSSQEDFGKILFMNWLSLSPEAVATFKSDMTKHGKMLIGMIETAINLLGDLKQLVPKLVALGRRHVSYGVQARFFESLGTALVQTLEESLSKDDFTAEVKSCWEIVFKMMATIMIHSIERSKEVEDASEGRTASTGGKSRRILLRHGLPLLLSMEMSHTFLKGNLVYYYKDEMLNFWRAVYEFKQMEMVEDQKTIEEVAKTIISKYLSTSSACNSLKIPDAIVKKTTAKSKFDSNMFDEAIEALEKEMSKRPFPRFSHSIGKNIQIAWDTLNEKLSTEKIGKILFMNFFMKDSDVMPMFKRDIEKHGAMLAGIIDMAIGSIGDLKSLLPSLIKLGVRHRSFGAIKPVHFDHLREAMIETFQSVMKDDFTDEMKESWRVIYNFLSAVMQTAMNGEIEGEDDEGTISDKASQDSRGTEGTDSIAFPLSIEKSNISKKKGTSSGLSSPKSGCSEETGETSLTVRKTKTEKCSVM